MSWLLRPQLTLLIVVFLLFIIFHLIVNNRRSPDCAECFRKIEKTTTDKPEIKLSQTDKPEIKLSLPRNISVVAPLAATSIDPSKRVKAAIVILARNGDVEGLNKTIPMFEKTFNARYQYPYVFLNDVPFTDHFKKEMRKLSPAPMSFGTVPQEHWSYPSWINVTKADECRKDMERRNIIYGGSLSYRHMCRFNSGFFYRHPLLRDYDYYWRVEPWVEFYCDVQYDPFAFMKEKGKEYGFTIMVPEYIETIPTLWQTVRQFMKENPSLVHPNNALKMFTNDEGGYNLCHFWSNFELGSLKLYRSGAYTKFFDYLDQAGGFFYERWGDAPVHSIAAAIFLPKEKIHWFEDIGYYHAPFYNCPSNPALNKHCTCDSAKSNHYNNDCHNRYLELYSGR